MLKFKMLQYDLKGLRPSGTCKEIYEVRSGRSRGVLRPCMASVRSVVTSEVVHGNRRCLQGGSSRVLRFGC